MKKITLIVLSSFVLASCSSSNEIKVYTLSEDGEPNVEQVIDSEEKAEEIQSWLEGLRNRKTNEFAKWNGYGRAGFEYQEQGGSIYVKDARGGALYIGEGMHYDLDEETLGKLYRILELEEEEVELLEGYGHFSPNNTERQQVLADS